MTDELTQSRKVIEATKRRDQLKFDLCEAERVLSLEIRKLDRVIRQAQRRPVVTT
jgi:hypothetical protein